MEIKCPTCGSKDLEIKKLVWVPESGESDLSPVALWDRCWNDWHESSSLNEPENNNSQPTKIN